MHQADKSTVVIIIINFARRLDSDIVTQMMGSKDFKFEKVIQIRKEKEREILICERDKVYYIIYQSTEI